MIFKTKPVFKEYIWGGTTFRDKYGKDVPTNTAAESWEISCHPNGLSLVDNGEYQGKTLLEVVQTMGVDFVGTRIGEKGVEKFPLLVKFLDAADDLSIQVHPEDEYANQYENGELGKTEMWVVLDAKPDATLIYGFKEDLTKEKFRQAIEEGKLEQSINAVKVKAGDVLFIKAKILHAIQKGLLIAEIQQNSDTTYRVYDWNRVDANGVGRPLHVEKAIDVTDLTNSVGKEKVEGLTIQEEGLSRTYLVACEYFAAEKLVLNGAFTQTLTGERFEMLLCLDGSGTIEAGGEVLSFKEGDSFVIPACQKSYTVKGEVTLLLSYVPDIEKEIVSPLLAKGFTQEDLQKIGGLA